MAIEYVCETSGKGNSGFNLIILGGGSAAFASAIKATELGARVAIVEEGVIGGTCLNRGCIPTKNLLRAGEIYYGSGKHNFAGINLKSKRLNFSALIEQKDKLVKDLRKAKYLDILKANPNIKFIKGRGEFLSDKEIKVGKDILKTEKFIIATGASPSILPIEGLDKVEYLTSTEALDLKKVPKSMIILGGRFVALEFAQMYSHFGTKVTVLQRSNRIIPDDEEEISAALQKFLEDEGIRIITGVKLLSVKETNGMKIVTCEIDGKRKDFKSESLLVATGRRPNTKGLGLEKAQVKLNDKGAIIVDDEMRTSVTNIFAAGDVTGEPMLVTVAAHQGAVAAQNAIDDCCHRKVNLSFVPHAIFTYPQVASVGLKEKEAIDKGYKVKIRAFDFHLVPKAAVIRDTRGLIKMVVEDGTDIILGVHILSPEAGDIIHEATVAVQKRMTIQEIIDTIHVYPTLSESIKMAAQSFLKDVSKFSCCAE
ncbi:MAG: mercury(II) reductase [Deltaproteobacteria bacterium]|nr:mercury(II) reductase [Deltaproteobacteria bacterium]